MARDLVALPREVALAIRRFTGRMFLRRQRAQSIVVGESELLDPFGCRATAVAAQRTRFPCNRRVNDRGGQRLAAMPTGRLRPRHDALASITRLMQPRRMPMRIAIATQMMGTRYQRSAEALISSFRLWCSLREHPRRDQ